MDDWLKTLKVGDEVCYDTAYISENYVIATVSGITPTGMVRLDNGLLFNKGGFCRDKMRNFRYHLQPVTDEIREKVRRKELLTLIGKFKFVNLTLAQLEAIAEIAGIGE